MNLFTKIMIYDIVFIAVEWYKSSFTTGNYSCHLRMKCSSDATFLMPWHGRRFKKVHSRGDIVPSWGLFKHFAMLVSFSSRFVTSFI